MKNIVGPKVKEARLKHSPMLTQEKLAAKLQLLGWNIQRSGVGKIEVGIREVTDIELLMLSEALTVSIPWLLYQKENKK